MAWQEHNNAPIPYGLLVRHEVCNNPGCVRGDHLSIGTSADNNRDQYVHGTAPVGERHGNAKLTADMVLAARNEYRTIGTPITQLAIRYGVNDMTMRDVLIGKSWRHLTGGVPVSPPRTRLLTDQERERIIDLRRSGLTQAEISEATGRGLTAVTGTLYRAGIKQSRPGRIRKV